MKDDFFSQYKNPAWQKKRLEVLSLANFTCQRCFSDESQLHVHHKRYVKGRKIWDYDTSELSALCDVCHSETHRAKDALNDIIAMLDPDGMSEVVALIAGYCSRVSGPAGVRGSSIEKFGEFSPPSFYAGINAALLLPEICNRFAEVALHLDARKKGE